MFLKSAFKCSALLFAIATMLPNAALAAEIVTLKAGTPVFLELTEPISSETHNTGSEVNLAVARDVQVDGVTVISKNTPATGQIIMSEQAGSVGSSGKISLSVDRTQDVTGQNVTLRSQMSSEGKDKEGASIALGVICCPLFLLVEGDEAAYPAGAEVKSYVAVDVEVDLSKKNK